MSPAEHKAHCNIAHAITRGRERHGLSEKIVRWLGHKIATCWNDHAECVVLLGQSSQGKDRTIWAVRLSLEPQPDVPWIPVVYDAATHTPTTILPADALGPYLSMLDQIERQNGLRETVTPAPPPATAVTTVVDSPEQFSPTAVDQAVCRWLGFSQLLTEMTESQLTGVLAEIKQQNVSLNQISGSRTPRHLAKLTELRRLRRVVANLKHRSHERNLLAELGITDTADAASVVRLLRTACLDAHRLLKLLGATDRLPPSFRDAMSAGQAYLELQLPT